MLPPIRAVSSSGTSYQSQTPFASSAHLAAAMSYGVRMAAGDLEIDAGIEGKLNMLLLSGRTDNLSVLAEALGKAIGLPRHEGEPGLAYALRLADALRALTPEERAGVQKQLSLLMKGITLDILIEALKNPAGPETARIVAYLEMARYKDRDLAAKSVVTSYRQNAGASEMAAEPGTGRAPPRTDFSSPPKGYDQMAAGDGARAAAMKPMQPTPPREKDNDIMKMQPLSRQAAGAERPVEDIVLRPAGRPVEIAAAEPGGTANARTLQDILKKTFEAGDSDNAFAEAVSNAPVPEETPENARAATMAKAGATAPERAGVQGQGIPAAHNHAATAQNHTILARPDETVNERRQTLFILKGWSEVASSVDEYTAETLYIIFDAEPAAADARGSHRPSAKTGGHSDAAPDAPLPARSNHEGDTDGFSPARPRRGGDAPDNGGQTDGVPPTAPSRAMPREAGTVAGLPQSPEQLVAAHLTIGGREAVPYAQVNYLPAPEMLPADETEDARQRFERGGGEDTHQEQEQADGNGAQGKEQAARLDEDIVPGDDGSEEDADHAYDLYRRMAGWA